MRRWVVWIFLAIIMIFIGWATKDQYNKDLGGTIMGIGFFLAGFLVIFAAYKNLK